MARQIIVAFVIGQAYPTHDSDEEWAIAALKRAGWVEVRQVGSHVRLRHPDRSEDLTVAMHAGTMPLGTLRSLLNQAGLSVERFKELH